MIRTLLPFEKFAANVRLAVGAKVYDASVLTAVPPSVQFTNVYPVLAVAVTVHTVPQSFVPPPLVDPPPGGLELVLITYVFRAKLATSVRFAVGVKLYD
jgi:hypothetical protein